MGIGTRKTECVSQGRSRITQRTSNGLGLKYTSISLVSSGGGAGLASGSGLKETRERSKKGAGQSYTGKVCVEVEGDINKVVKQRFMYLCQHPVIPPP